MSISPIGMFLMQKRSGPKIHELKNYVHCHLDEDIDLSALASAAGCDVANFRRWFRGRYQVSPVRWLWSIRVSVAARLVALPYNFALNEIAFSCGFKSAAHFTRLFRELVGMNPSEYRRSRQTQETVQPVGRVVSLLDLALAQTAIVLNDWHQRVIHERQDSLDYTTQGESLQFPKKNPIGAILRG